MTKKTKQKNLKCLRCGNVFPIWRKENKNKSPGHYKGLYCHKCKRKTKHRELSEYYYWEEAIKCLH